VFCARRSIERAQGLPPGGRCGAAPLRTDARREGKEGTRETTTEVRRSSCSRVSCFFSVVVCLSVCRCLLRRVTRHGERKNLVFVLLRSLAHRHRLSTTRETEEKKAWEPTIAEARRTQGESMAGRGRMYHRGRSRMYRVCLVCLVGGVCSLSSSLLLLFFCSSFLFSSLSGGGQTDGLAATRWRVVVGRLFVRGRSFEVVRKRRRGRTDGWMVELVGPKNLFFPKGRCYLCTTPAGCGARACGCVGSG